MKKIFLILVLLSYFNTYSQDKRIIYSDEDLNELTKDEYKNNPLNKYFREFKSENDSTIVYLKVAREKAGRISKEVFKNIKNQLISSSKTKIDSTQTVIINFHPDLEGSVRSSVTSTKRKMYKKYIKEISKRKDIAQFFVYEKTNETKGFPRKIDWIKDQNQLIKNTFFKFHFPYGSYIIIKPNGNYYSLRGEHRITNILNKI